MTTLAILAGLFLGPVLVGALLVWTNDALEKAWPQADYERWRNQ